MDDTLFHDACVISPLRFALFANVLIVVYSIQAARDTGALKEAKDKLEKRVEELTWRLQIEKRLRVTSLSNISIAVLMAGILLQLLIA